MLPDEQQYDIGESDDEVSEPELIVYSFSNNHEYLFAEMGRIDLLIQHYLKCTQRVFDSGIFHRGLYLTIDDIREQYKRPIGRPWWSTLVANDEHTTNQSTAIHSQSARILQEISNAKEKSQRQGEIFWLDRIRQVFNLNQYECDVILLALTAEIDLRYEMIFAYLQDDVTRKYLCVDLVLDILSADESCKFERRRHFAPDSRLISNQLVILVDDPARPVSGLLGKIVKLSPRIVDFVLYGSGTDKSIDRFVQRVNKGALSEITVTTPSKEKINSILRNTGRKAIVYFQGGKGSGRECCALYLAHKRALSLLKVNLAKILAEGISDFDEIFSAIKREAALINAAVYIYPLDLILVDDRIKVLHSILHFAETHDGFVMFGGQPPLDAKSTANIKHYFHVEIPETTVSARIAYWQSELNKVTHKISEHEVSELADRFRFSPGQIADAVKTARQTTASAGLEKQIDINHIFQACRLNTNRNLGKLARRVSPKYTWLDITLKPDTFRKLRELDNTARHFSRILDDWGFDRKLSIGKGVNALFTGPPGTGKTMAAEIVANSLGLELYKIDLSLIVSKYIGETEKNLSRIFSEAETSNAILFFDEADALFGKRTEVKSSHDRYANVEVAYLLQKMEDYTGITIMATNLRRNMDEAFIRRLAFIISFPFPEYEERKKIWTGIWPEEVPLAREIDFDFLARNFKLAGGNIKNIALAASFLAAEHGQIEMKHLLIATKDEFEKQGRTLVKNDFGKYGELLESKMLV